ncbi:phosphoinositide-interacting protein-like [Melanotaenia boesemani]|uniref:phosphoinositide-interacting protein-like n=1 Tax=Melanotaenia boesemani TaxID=1250792 RepID=UPI001C044BEF|nr:phosphoinositide-interacting protein-like [Melanotaenia boesemani]
METIRETLPPDGSESLCPDPQSAAAMAPGWTYFHKPITAIVMGALMSATGSLLFLIQPSGVTDASRSVASACLSIGLMFVVVGLVWIPILKEKHRRQRFSQGA